MKALLVAAVALAACTPGLHAQECSWLSDPNSQACVRSRPVPQAGAVPVAALPARAGAGSVVAGAAGIVEDGQRVCAVTDAAGRCQVYAATRSEYERALEAGRQAGADGSAIAADIGRRLAAGSGSAGAAPFVPAATGGQCAVREQGGHCIVKAPTRAEYERAIEVGREAGMAGNAILGDILRRSGRGN